MYKTKKDVTLFYICKRLIKKIEKWSVFFPLPTIKWGSVNIGLITQTCFLCSVMSLNNYFCRIYIHTCTNTWNWLHNVYEKNPITLIGSAGKWICTQEILPTTTTTSHPRIRAHHFCIFCTHSYAKLSTLNLYP